MATAAGIWSHAAGASSAGVTAMDNSAGSTTGTSSSNSATITANDFLTLLVTEMKNQDPTADNDPNQYINQLVNVNSLEQLIGINQTLETAFPASGSGTGTPGGSGGTAGSNRTTHSIVSNQALQTGNSVSANPAPEAVKASPQQSVLPVIPGNLSIPEVNPAARSVAQALSGHQRSFTH